MNIFVYGDESGVFDAAHYDTFVFGGLFFFNKEERDKASRMFSSAENKLKPSYNLSSTRGELKGSILKPKHKSGLFRSLSKFHRYAFVINLKSLNGNFFGNKKSKQRYMDYAFKVGLKNVLARCIRRGEIDKSDVDSLYIRFDEHATATDGCYELKESIEAEFKHGMNNFRWNLFHPPLFPDMRGEVALSFKDSKNDSLIRASDIVANVALHYVRTNRLEDLKGKLSVVEVP